MTDCLYTVADEFLVVSPDSPRALPSQELADYLNNKRCNFTHCASVPDAIKTALEKADEDTMIFTAGSVYLAGEIRACLGFSGDKI